VGFLINHPDCNYKSTKPIFLVVVVVVVVFVVKPPKWVVQLPRKPPLFHFSNFLFNLDRAFDGPDKMYCTVLLLWISIRISLLAGNFSIDNNCVSFITRFSFNI
jgi:hypothetical protein